MGVNWRFSKPSGLPIKGDIGISFAHVNTPNSSFLEENIRFPLKSSFYAKAEIDLKINFGLEPYFIFIKHGTASEFIYGLNGVFKLNEGKLKLGIGSRSKDALILMASFSFKNIELGFS